MAPVDEMPLEKWNDLMQVNLTAPFMLSKHVVPAMKKKGENRFKLVYVYVNIIIKTACSALGKIKIHYSIVYRNKHDKIFKQS